MKKIKLILAAAALALMAMLVGCSKRGYGTSSKTGISINGVVWAECNVDAPGTFAASAELPGMLYQWNRKTAWPATGDVTGWDATDASGDVWDAANDPCPVGWRVPTKAEQATLAATDKVTYEWTDLNGVDGGRFTDKVSGATIFFPAAGFRDNTAGALFNAGDLGYYWSTSSTSTAYSWYLYSHIKLASQNYDYSRSTGFSVRCVSSGNQMHKSTNKETKSPKNGILINGVHWAKCNVDTPGTFATSAELPGMFYQWNRKKAWPAAGTGSVTRWDHTDPTGDVWDAANDPCPVGWRVPTKAELATLVATDKVIYEWTDLNGKTGYRFTDRASGATIWAIAPATPVRCSTRATPVATGPVCPTPPLTRGACTSTARMRTRATTTAAAASVCAASVRVCSDRRWFRSIK